VNKMIQSRDLFEATIRYISLIIGIFQIIL